MKAHQSTLTSRFPSRWLRRDRPQAPRRRGRGFSVSGMVSYWLAHDRHSSVRWYVRPGRSSSGARRSESPIARLRDGWRASAGMAKVLVSPQTLDRSAGLDRRRVPYNKGTRRHQPERRVRGGKRCVAATAEGPSVAVTGRRSGAIGGDYVVRCSVPDRVDLWMRRESSTEVGRQEAPRG
jgi:hypothetical protein